MHRIYLAGRVAVEGPSGIVDERDFPGGQGRLAFSVIVLERGPIPRDRLADVVWGERIPESWSGDLSAVLSKIRRALRSVGIDATAAVLAGPGAVEFRRPAPTWVDYEYAMTAVDAAEGHLRNADPRRAWSEASTAFAIAKRGFLAGDISEWAEQHRRTLLQAAIRALQAVADSWMMLGQPNQALVALDGLLGLDRLREATYRRQIEAHTAAGDRTAALIAYQACEQMMREEFGVAPSTQTQAVYEAALG